MQDTGNGTNQLAPTVARHYNELQEGGLDKRFESRIVYLRNFNNWVKSMLIGDTLKKIKKSSNARNNISVLDICCGKGGDLRKWRTGAIHHLVCADIAGTSVEQCWSRYKEMKKFNNRIFSAEFITADCTKVRLKDLYKSEKAFDLVSCQFSFHYCFESYPQADMMLRNISECLKPGGFFIGTTPDSNQIIHKLRESDSNSFGNDVYRITFISQDKDHFPLFGTKYDFHLEGVVDCPEFLVYFPALEKLAEKYGLKLEFKYSFPEYCNQFIHNHPDRMLLEKMKALETYPADALVGKSSDDYKHMMNAVKDDSRMKFGTLSQPEWEAACLYLVFAFKKL